MTPYMFFKKNAGYSYGPDETPEQGRIRCARALAKAERDAHDVWNIEFQWQEDIDGCIGCDCGSDDCDCASGASHETLFCIARSGNTTLASLSGICSPTREYARVIEAELALEAIAELQRIGAEVTA